MRPVTSAVSAASACLTGLRLSRPECTTPRVSTTATSLTPAASRMRVTATPAAPAPETTTRVVSISRPVSLSAFSRAASTTTAVPCWSSWNTGMSSSCLSRSSISKQRGAEMSSRLIPPKLGASRTTVSTISSVSWVSSVIGTASTPPNALNSTALPSITGIAARGPMLPRPSTAEPSVTIGRPCWRPTCTRRAAPGRRRSPRTPGRRPACRPGTGRRDRSAARSSGSPSCRRRGGRRPGRRPVGSVGGRVLGVSHRLAMVPQGIGTASRSSQTGRVRAAGGAARPGATRDGQHIGVRDRADGRRVDALARVVALDPPAVRRPGRSPA